MTQHEIDAIIEETIVGEWSKPIPGPAKAAFGKIIEQHGDRVFLGALVAYREANGGYSAPQPTPGRLREHLPRDKNEPKAPTKTLHWFDSTGDVSEGFFNQQPEPNEETADWILRLNIDRLRGGTSVNVKAVERLINFFAPPSFWQDNHGGSKITRDEVWQEAREVSRQIAAKREEEANRAKAGYEASATREEARKEFLESAGKLAGKVKDMKRGVN